MFSQYSYFPAMPSISESPLYTGRLLTSEFPTLIGDFGEECENFRITDPTRHTSAPLEAQNPEYLLYIVDSSGEELWEWFGSGSWEVCLCFLTSPLRDKFRTSVSLMDQYDLRL